MFVLLRHSIGHGSYLPHLIVDIHLSHRKKIITETFIFITVGYLPSLNYRMLGGETYSNLLEHGSIQYTLYREHTEYMMVAIVWNRWGRRKHFSHVTGRCTPKVSIPALSKFLYVLNDFHINLHSVHTETTLCRYFLNSHSRLSTCREP